MRFIFTSTWVVLLSVNNSFYIFYLLWIFHCFAPRVRVWSRKLWGNWKETIRSNGRILEIFEWAQTLVVYFLQSCLFDDCNLFRSPYCKYCIYFSNFHVSLYPALPAYSYRWRRNVTVITLLNIGVPSHVQLYLTVFHFCSI